MRQPEQVRSSYKQFKEAQLTPEIPNPLKETGAGKKYLGAESLLRARH
jgi:hypothetical protein